MKKVTNKKESKKVWVVTGNISGGIKVFSSLQKAKDYFLQWSVVFVDHPSGHYVIGVWWPQQDKVDTYILEREIN